MPPSSDSLGKLIAVHSTAPYFLQRAAIVAGLSFLFFLAALIFFLLWGSFIYFLLSTAFLIIQLFTMIGWWLQRRNAVLIYTNGMTYKKSTMLWNDLASVTYRQGPTLHITGVNGVSFSVPRTIHALDSVARHIGERIGEA